MSDNEQQPEPRRHGLRPGKQNIAGSSGAVGCTVGCLVVAVLLVVLGIMLMVGSY